jgi:hypothetical protein
MSKSAISEGIKQVELNRLTYEQQKQWIMGK